MINPCTRMFCSVACGKTDCYNHYETGVQHGEMRVYWFNLRSPYCGWIPPVVRIKKQPSAKTFAP